MKNMYRFIVFILLVTSLFPARRPAQAAALAFNAVADAYVLSERPKVNYGANAILRLDANPAARSYLRFIVSGLQGQTVRSAVLRVYANSASADGFAVYSLPGGGWKEDRLTFANAPYAKTLPANRLIAQSQALRADRWVEVDLGGYITDDGSYELLLVTDSKTNISLAARETQGKAPQLVIEGQAAPGLPATGKPGGSLVVRPAGTAGAGSLPSASARPGDILLMAGDICKANDKGAPNCALTANVVQGVLAANPNAQLQLLGDNVYDASPTSYQQLYAPYWGKFMKVTRAAMGNHDVRSPGGTQYYFDYFGATAGPKPGGYYSYNIGSAWHVVVLNSNCAKIDGCEPGSPQYTWLQKDLAANTRKCLMAVWHHPRYTSGRHPDDPKYASWWDLLYQYRADIVAVGHNHQYERFKPLNGKGQPAADGIRQFVVGTGGASGDAYDYQERPLGPNEAVRNQDVLFGVLQLTLTDGAYAWDFLPAAGFMFKDSGSAACH